MPPCYEEYDSGPDELRVVAPDESERTGVGEVKRVFDHRV